MKKELILMIGLPASGKSTYAKYYADKFDSVEYISRDEIRFSLLDENDDYFAKEKNVYDTLVKKAKESLNENTITIVDATHINEASRSKLLNRLETTIIKNRARVKFFYMKTPFETCEERNESRDGEKRVPDEAMKRFFRQLTLPTTDELNKRKFTSSLHVIREDYIIETVELLSVG